MGMVDETMIIGHALPRAQLSHVTSLQAGPQCFLFSGPRHVGKRLVAEWFANQLIGAGESTVMPDLLVIEPEVVATAKHVKTKPITIDTVREVRHFLSRTPLSGHKRVVIVDQAETLGVGAANALLKILEEPPRDSVLILITAERERLLSTLLSRLFPVTFRPLSPMLLREAFPEASALPQFFFDLGLPGIIVRALSHADLFETDKTRLRDLFQLSRLSLRDRLALAEELALDEESTLRLLELWYIGLSFQARAQAPTVATGRYAVLTMLTQTLADLAESRGSSRSLLERLFLSIP